MLLKLRSYLSFRFYGTKKIAAVIVAAFIISLSPSISKAVPCGSEGGPACGSNAGTSGGLGGLPISADIGSNGGSLSVGGLTFRFGQAGGGAGGISDALCTIVGWFTIGGVGSAVASLAVIFLGIGAFFGKVTWGMALMFASGIFAIFGAGDIVAAITGDQDFGHGCDY